MFNIAYNLTQYNLLFFVHLFFLLLVILWDNTTVFKWKLSHLIQGQYVGIMQVHAQGTYCGAKDRLNFYAAITQNNVIIKERRHRMRTKRLLGSRHHLIPLTIGMLLPNLTEEFCCHISAAFTGITNIKQTRLLSKYHQR